MLTFIFHTDPGHGWLEVDEMLVLSVGIRVSSCSYKRRDKLFLEEDCDAPRLIEALKVNDIEYKIISKNTDYDSPIRSYARC